MRGLRRDSPQDLSCIYVPDKCTIERFVSSPKFTTFTLTDKQSEDIMLYLRYYFATAKYPRNHIRSSRL